jgi:hypothetical protein
MVALVGAAVCFPVHVQLQACVAHGGAAQCQPVAVVIMAWTFAMYIGYIIWCGRQAGLPGAQEHDMHAQQLGACFFFWSNQTL